MKPAVTKSSSAAFFPVGMFGLLSQALSRGLLSRRRQPHRLAFQREQGGAQLSLRVSIFLSNIDWRLKGVLIASVFCPVGPARKFRHAFPAGSLRFPSEEFDFMQS